jgi:hypothetical protein
VGIQRGVARCAFRGNSSGTAGLGERRLLRGVTLVQTALTLALLVGAGLLIRTMVKIAGSRRVTRPDGS